MATLVKTYVQHVQYGDHLIVNNKEFIVKYIDGPDSIGTYNVHLVDGDGNSHVEIVTGLVTILM
jgi:hypothetical protein